MAVYTLYMEWFKYFPDLITNKKFMLYPYKFFHSVVDIKIFIELWHFLIYEYAYYYIENQ